MPQLAYQLECGPRPWTVHTVSGTTCTVQATEDIAVIWSDGHTDTIAQGTQAALFVGGPAVDSGANLYLLVAVHGQASITLVRLADALTAGIDGTLAPGAQWGVLAELTHNRVREHQQTAGAGAGTAAIKMAKDDALVGTEPEISLNEGNLIQITAADDSADKRVDYTFALAPGTTGDILRYNGSAWEKYGIGNAGDVLTVVDGLPVWRASTGASPSTAIYSSVAWKMRSLYPGSTPPAGWNLPGFDTSSWGYATIADDNSIYTPIPGAVAIWPTFHGPGVPEHTLAVTTFTLPRGVATSCTLSILADDQINGCWLNGTLIPGTVQPFVSFPHAPYVISVDIGIPIPGVTNTIAAWAINNVDPTRAGLWVALGVNT